MLESSYASCCLFQLLSHNAVNEQQKQSKSIQSCRHDLWRGGCQSKPQPGVDLLAGSEAFDTITDITVEAYANVRAFTRTCADKCTRSSGEQTGNQFDDVLIASGAQR